MCEIFRTSESFNFWGVGVGGLGAWGSGGLLVSPNQLASCGNLLQRAAANMKPALTLDKKKKEKSESRTEF